ncbi:MAG: antitoxin HicB [Actinomycetaceae bacterium]|nr:antitoxin HicB [Actinomycetaceae bacterium]MDY5273640.1 antitoxin HicB [Arcanobacterium sp.]
MTSLTITARRWNGGWELWHGDDIWTQVRTLPGAHQQIIDYLDTVEDGVDHSSYEITIIPELPTAAHVEEAKEASQRAEEAQKAAYASSRRTVRTLREDGFSLADIGYVMGLSRARVSQLAREA